MTIKANCKLLERKDYKQSVVHCILHYPWWLEGDNGENE